MIKIITSLAIGLSVLCIQSCADKKSDKKSETKSDTIAVSDVPATVQSAFSAKYSTASDILWEDATEDEKQTYKAKFTLNGKKMKAEFDASGAFIKENEDD